MDISAPAKDKATMTTPGFVVQVRISQIFQTIQEPFIVTLLATAVKIVTIPRAEPHDERGKSKVRLGTKRYTCSSLTAEC